MTAFDEVDWSEWVVHVLTEMIIYDGYYETTAFIDGEFTICYGYGFTDFPL